MNLLRKAKPATGLIVRKNGNIDVHPVKTASLDGVDGKYDADHSYRLNLPRKVPAGPVFIWAEGDPEGFTGREPVGANAGVLDRLTGGYVSHVLAGAMERNRGFPKWAKWVAVAAAVLVVVGVVVYTVWKKKQGA